MSDACCTPPAPSADPAYQRILWIALALNAAMFVIEIIGSLESGSVSLLADAIDFFGDAANYGLSLLVLSRALHWRARSSLLKAASMAGFGLFVLGRAAWAAWHGAPPEALTMGAIALLALAVNVGVAVMLYRYRNGDSNMRSVWLCSRNDAVGNIAVALAAVAVAGTGAAWPDLIVAVGMAALALSSAWAVSRQALGELRRAPA
ncbi:cation transporter [Rhizobacter sp. Root404]|uniref:cation transporter n=1 Tax=Rhizobacter sp. Root404 TaxID=1736528 RepID=UPI0006F52A99|nr:cation transporter [Rhizobacter sp. Root404]KQW35945.1 cation transporter [Rhizobacter sp. Root404]